MRIAFFSDAYHPRVSGQVVSIDEFSHALTERGHQVCIVCPAYPPDRMAGHNDRYKTIRAPSGTAFVSGEDRLALPWYSYDILRQVDDFDPQVVHIHTEFSIGAMGRRYCRSRGFPVLSTCHTHYALYMEGYLPFLSKRVGIQVARAWLRSIYSRDDLIITPSKSIRDEMIENGIDREYLVIPTGVDDRVFRHRSEEAAEFRKDLALARPGFDTSHLLLYVGRIGKEKNIDLLVRALPRIFAQDPKARLLIVGEGPYREELTQFLAAEQLADKVAWMDYQPRSRLPAIYSAADIFTFPSKTETQGLVTIEALLCGTPVVGVDAMGTGEILAGDIGGYLSKDDPEDYAAGILRLLSDPALRRAKSEQGLAHARKWSISALCDELEVLYRRMFNVGSDPKN
jgi:glycosyltransferase involved in cell wall biosynthesis